MKKLQTLLGIALSGVLLSVGITASAQPARPGYATVIRVKGIANYSLDGSQWHPLVAGKFLAPGASISTGDDGVVDVVLGKAVELPQAKWQPERISLAADSPVRGMNSYKASVEQNVVRLTGNTVLVIDKLTTTDSGADTVSDTELDLKKGGIYASVKKLSAASQYIVKTPTGIAGVRGTEFSLTLNPDGTISALEVFKSEEGVVLAPNSATPAFVISQGNAYVNGNPTPIAIKAEIINRLMDIFTSMPTIFIEVINFDFDHTQILESQDIGGSR